MVGGAGSGGGSYLLGVGGFGLIKVSFCTSCWRNSTLLMRLGCNGFRSTYLPRHEPISNDVFAEEPLAPR